MDPDRRRISRVNAMPTVNDGRGNTAIREKPGAGGEPCIPIGIIADLAPDVRLAGIEILAALLTADRAGCLDERLTDRRIAEAIGRSKGYVQEGLLALDRKGYIERARHAGRRTIRLRLAGRGGAT